VRNWRDPGHYNGRVDFGDGQNLQNTGVCDACHGSLIGVEDAKQAWLEGGSIQDCTGCHNSAQPGWLHGQPAPAVDAYWTANGHGQAAGASCQSCHNPDSPHFTPEYDPRLWDSSPALCARCHSLPDTPGVVVSPHGNQNYEFATQPAFVVNCTDCHNPHGSRNLAAIREKVWGREIAFFNRTGQESFDEPDQANDDDICATCHTTTAHNRNPANWPEKIHYEGGDCAFCHPHEGDGDPFTDDGFTPQVTCLDCHNQQQDNGDGAPPGGRRPVQDDFVKRSHHLKGEPSQQKCVVCHDQSTHGDGYIDLRMPDGGPSLRFVRAQDIDLSEFCQGCHDKDGSQNAMTPNGNSRDPFGEGSNLLALPAVGAHGNRDFHNAQEEPFRETCNTCHAGHGSDNLALIQTTINGNPVRFLSRTGADSFDDPNKDDRYDLCATCHLGRTSVHPGGDHRPAGDLDLRGADCTTCHLHDADKNIDTLDGFMPSCQGCHGSPPPPASRGDYPLDETLTPHEKHAGSGPGQYGLPCSTCHDRSAPGYAGHATEPPTFQDVFFDARNPAGVYDANTRTCANLGCHSNGSPSTGAPVFQLPKWHENSFLNCSGCHGDQLTLTTGSHSKHLLSIYSQRGRDAIGCYECHADTARNNDNAAIANTKTHVDLKKQVRIDVRDLWGQPDSAAFNPADLTCANSLCHSDGAASREQPGAPTFANPRWGDRASGSCGVCHPVSPQTLTTGAHARHFDSSEQGPGITNCDTCHSAYMSGKHVNGRVDFADGQTLSQTTVCDDCHSPGGAVDGVAEARAAWLTGAALSCEGCHDSEPAVVKGVQAPDIAGDGVSYGFGVTGHGRAGIPCALCHQKGPDSVHFDGAANSYRAEKGNYRQTRWLVFGGLVAPITQDQFYQASNYAQCLACHKESDVVGLEPDYSNALFTHTAPPPEGYPIIVEQVVTAFRNERVEGFNLGNVPANIHWDHLDMNMVNWDSDRDGVMDSKPSCITCHDPHGVKSVDQGEVYPSMTFADMGVVHRQDELGAYGAVTRTDYLTRCNTCHPAADIRYYRTTGR